MKVSAFVLNPHRELPSDFADRYESVWVNPPWHELADPERVGQYYNWTLDELLYAARAGFDGICTNEHHQNAYGFMPNPNIMGGILARETADLDVAIVQMGSTIPAVTPAVRIAEEYGMLDAISGGRLVAGLPMGSAMDMNLGYGIPPIDLRERFREGLELVLRAWQNEGTFAHNGRFQQLGMVNPWPRPIQQPHPPVWLTSATGSKSTVQTALDHGFCYCFLGHAGPGAADRIISGYWDRVEEAGEERNPYRLGFLQMAVVADTDAEAERLYKDHIEYFFHKSWHLPRGGMWMTPPGNLDYPSLRPYLQAPSRSAYKDMSYKDFVDQEFVLCGSAETVRERLYSTCKRLNSGNVMLVVQIGSMPHELTLYNIDKLASEVLPHLRSLWADTEYENLWWPARLRQSVAQSV